MSCPDRCIVPPVRERALVYFCALWSWSRRWAAPALVRVHVVGVLALMLVAPLSAFAQATPSFFNQIGTATDMSAADACASSFSSELTGGGLIERPSSEIETMMRECVEDLSSPEFTRECNLQAAVGQVDYVVVYNVSREEDEWYFHIEALSPMQQGTVWQQGTLVAESRAIRGAMTGCRELAQDFLVRQGFVEPDDRRSRRRRESSDAGVEIVMVSPSPVTVLVNGAEVGVAPGTFDVPADQPVELELRSARHFAWVETVEVRAGTVLTLSERRLTAWPATVEVESNVDGTEVLLDGSVVGATRDGRPFTLSLAPGEYEVDTRHAGYLPWSTTLNVGPGEALVVTADLQPVRLPFEAATRPSVEDNPSHDVSADARPTSTFRLSCRGQRALGGMLTALGIGLAGYGSYLSAVARVTRSPGEPWEDQMVMPERRAAGVGLLVGGIASGGTGVWQLTRGCR